MNMFVPELFYALKSYTRQQFNKDVLAGIIVGIVALPLAIAFAIASGVAPEKGLYTAIIAGFLISALGGSKVQIGGPTGAFIVIVYDIVQVHGVGGLIIATFMAGVILVIMGLVRFGAVIKFIPYPLVSGFTSGIAVVIFATQVKDVLGLKMEAVPAGFLNKWISYFENIRSINPYALALAIATILIVQFTPKLTRKLPGSLIALLLLTVVVQLFQLPVATIGSRFGAIASSFPSPSLSLPDYSTFRSLVQPAITIALLGAIESLLSAVVADGMTGDNHRSNTELIAQGTSNVFSALFGGIPATGAIARTATNVKNGGRTPVAGMVHALVLLVIMLFAGKWAVFIPMPVLAGILVVVAYNMSEWESFISILKGPVNDRVILLITFFLTVLVDLTVAIEVGMILAAFLFMRLMIHSTSVSQLRNGKNKTDVVNDIVPNGVDVFEITGPLFFGAAYKFRDAIKLVKEPPRVLIIRMRQVPVIDATGIKTLKEIYKDARRHGTKLILSEVISEPLKKELKDARLLFAIGKANVTDSFSKAVERSRAVL